MDNPARARPQNADPLLVREEAEALRKLAQIHREKGNEALADKLLTVAAELEGRAARAEMYGKAET